MALGLRVTVPLDAMAKVATDRKTTTEIATNPRARYAINM